MNTTQKERVKNKYKVLWHDDEIDSVWDNFAASIPGGHNEQTTRWAKARTCYGWKSSRIHIEEENELIAGATLLYRTFPIGGKVGYISHGPCLKYPSADLLERTLSEILKGIKNKKFFYIVINSPYYANYMIPVFLSKGFLPIADGLPPKGLITSTLLIDLNKDLQELLRDMKKKTRYNIHNALKRNFTIREGTRKDIELFYQLMLSTCQRRGVEPAPAGMDFYLALWDEFSNTGWLRLSIVEFNNEAVCAGLDFSYGDVYRAWKSGWNGKYAHLHPNEFLEWKSMEWAKTHGFQYYDVVSVDTKVVKGLESGKEPSPDLKAKSFFGPTIYKMGFGGDILHLSGAYSYFPNPLIRKGVALAEKLILQKPWFKDLVERCWKKIKSHPSTKPHRRDPSPIIS